MAGPRRLLSILFFLALQSVSVTAEYQRGDLVPTSRRGQFHGVRRALRSMRFRTQQAHYVTGPVVTAVFLKDLTRLHPPLCSNAHSGTTSSGSSARTSPLSRGRCVGLQRETGRPPPSPLAPRPPHSSPPPIRPAAPQPLPPTPSSSSSPQVVVPIPRPVGFSAADDYKLSLSFDHDRFLTPWLLVMGPKAPQVPMVHVQLARARWTPPRRQPPASPAPPPLPRPLGSRANERRCGRALPPPLPLTALQSLPIQAYSGGQIRKVAAAVVPVPDEIRAQHEELAKARFPPAAPPRHRSRSPPLQRPLSPASARVRAQEFADPTSWPKRLLVHYEWVEDVEVDANMGLWVLLVFGARFCFFPGRRDTRQRRQRCPRRGSSVCFPCRGGAG